MLSSKKRRVAGREAGFTIKALPEITEAAMQINVMRFIMVKQINIMYVDVVTLLFRLSSKIVIDGAS